MGRLSILSEALMQVARPKTLSDEKSYRQALALLRDGVMPMGETWGDGPPPLFVHLGGSDSCVVMRERRESVDDPLRMGRGTRFWVRFSVKPGRSGGAGVSIDPVATEAFMSQAMAAPCDDHLALEHLAAAVRVVSEERLDSVQGAIRKLFWEDGIWRLVGWRNADQWELETIEVTRVDLGEAVVGENRGEDWVAKRWEAWVPFTCDVEATLWRKK